MSHLCTTLPPVVIHASIVTTKRSFVGGRSKVIDKSTCPSRQLIIVRRLKVKRGRLESFLCRKEKRKVTQILNKACIIRQLWGSFGVSVTIDTFIKRQSFSLNRSGDNYTGPNFGQSEKTLIKRDHQKQHHYYGAAVKKDLNIIKIAIKKPS